MPIINVNGVKYYYEESGNGPETIVFSHGFLWSGRMYAKQVEFFKENYRVITYDHRGQGRTEVTRAGYDMNTLTEDTVALIRALDAVNCHFVGLSMGSYVGMRLASRHPDLLKSLTLMETRADAETFFSGTRLRILGFIARYVRTKAVAQGGMQEMFGKTFMHDPQRATEREYWQNQILQNNPAGSYRALLGVITRQSVENELKNINVPTLIMVGDEDIATVPAKAQQIHEVIPQSELIILRKAGHTSTVEQPEQVNQALSAFFSKLV